MENGKLWSGSKFAKYKTLFPDRFCLYENCVSSVAAVSDRHICDINKTKIASEPFCGI